MKHLILGIGFVLSALVQCETLQADVRMPAVIGEHMVLQQAAVRPIHRNACVCLFRPSEPKRIATTSQPYGSNPISRYERGISNDPALKRRVL